MTTLSATSSAVCPVQTSSGRAPYRAWRARASRFGPTVSETVRCSKAAPTDDAMASTCLPSAAEPSRRPWSTCHAVTCDAPHTCTASARRARESAPPLTAQCSEPDGNEVSGANRLSSARAAAVVVIEPVSSNRSSPGPPPRPSNFGGRVEEVQASDPRRRVTDLGE